MDCLRNLGGRYSAGMAGRWVQVVLLLAATLGLGCTESQDPIFGLNGVIPLDRTPPQVTETVPATAVPAVTGVSIGTLVTATFTENMAPASLDRVSFTVSGPGATPVAGAVTYASRTATFMPTLGLAGNQTFTATITMKATDTSGNALSGNQAAPPGPSSYIWTFTTGPAPPPSFMNPGVVQAFGQIQASADGAIRNDGVAGEPVPAKTTADANRTIQVRHGFYIPPAL